MAFQKVTVSLENRTTFNLIRADYEIEDEGNTGPPGIGPGQTGSWVAFSSTVFSGGTSGYMQYGIVGNDGAFLAYVNTRYNIPMVGSNDYRITVTGQPSNFEATGHNGGSNTSVRFVLEGVPGAFVVKVFPEGTVELGEVSTGAGTPPVGLDRYAAIFREGGGWFSAVPDWDWDGLNKLIDENASHGFIMTNIDGFVVDGQVRYAGLFRQGAGDYVILVDWKWSDLYSEIEKNASQGLLPVDISAYVLNGEVRYSMIFHSGGGAYTVIPDWDWSSLYQEIDNNNNLGLHMKTISGFLLGDQIRYAAVFRDGSGPQIVVPNWDWESMFNIIGENLNAGLYMTDISAFSVGGQILYAGIFHQGSGNFYVIPNWIWNDLLVEIGTDAGTGLFLTALENCS